MVEKIMIFFYRIGEIQNMKKLYKWFLPILVAIAICFNGCGNQDTANNSQVEASSSVSSIQEASSLNSESGASESEIQDSQSSESKDSKEPIDIENAAGQASEFSMSMVPEFAGSPYVEINGNIPWFNDEDMTTESYEYYSPLDTLGRCGVCIASIGQDLMPTEERGSIGSVKPSGWHLVKYNGVVDGNYLYNRCHLIGYQLSGENANVSNLITGTRYLNVNGMLGFENEVADYVQSTGNHVLYRVTPIFEDDNLVASGVLMEAKSVEDAGAGICFNVFCYNVQPGVAIDYATGDSALDGTVEESAKAKEETETQDQQQVTEETNSNRQAAEKEYVVNTNTNKFHRSDCSSVKKMKDKNKMEFTGSRDELINQGYEPCRNCNP